MSADIAGATVLSHDNAAGTRSSLAIERLVLTFLGLLFLAPFVLPIHRRPQPAFDAEWLAAILLTCSAVLVGVMKRRAVLVSWPLPAWLAAMVGVVALQYVTGRLHYPAQLVFASLYAFAIAGAYGVGRAIVAAQMRERASSVFATALLAGSVASVLIQWLQLLGVSGLPAWLYFEILDPWYRTRPVANLAQVNLLATYFVWSLFAVLLLLQRSLRPVVALGLAFVLAMGLALTRSRMGLVFSFGVLAALWLPWALRPANPRLRAGMTAALALGYLVGTSAVALFVAYQGAAVDNAIQRFGEAGGFAVRLVMWVDAVKVAATAPWLGVGFGDYAAHQYWIADAVPHVQPTIYVHNLVLQTAAELGWPMAAALSAIGLWWATAQWKERMRSREAAFAWALVILVGAHSLLEWPLASMHFALPAAILFALAEPHLERKRAAVDSRLFVAAGVAGLLLALPMKLEFDELSDVATRAETERKSAKGVDASTVMRMLALGETARMRIYADNLLVYLRAPAAVEASDFEIARHERMLIAGGEPRLIARLVILYAKAGRIDESVRHAERLRVFNRGQYVDLAKTIVDAVEPLGAAADPLRRQLVTGAAMSL